MSKSVPAQARDPRRELRTELFLQIEFEHEGRSSVGFCRNMSLTGMFIETTEPAPFGATLLLDVPLPGMRARIEAYVRWTKSEGMGVQFGPMGARETHALMQLLDGR